MSFEKVLIVDDAQVDRFLAKAIMTKHHFAKEILTADSAVDALEFLGSCETDPDLLPNIIFLDINMPHMSGFDFLDEYKNFPPEITNRCAIVMLSSSTNQKDIDQSLNYRFVNDFISKPLSLQKLAALELK